MSAKKKSQKEARSREGIDRGTVAGGLAASLVLVVWAFVQVNSDINQRMVHFAVEQLEAGPDDKVLDLFCGIGNFSLPLARRSAAVLGVEMDDMLVKAAAANAAWNKKSTDGTSPSIASGARSSAATTWAPRSAR